MLPNLSNLQIGCKTNEIGENVKWYGTIAYSYFAHGDSDEKDNIFIDELFVREQYRGKKYAYALLYEFALEDLIWVKWTPLKRFLP